MAAGSKTVKIQGTFGVQDAAGTSSPFKVFKDLTLVVGQVQSSDPMCITGTTADFVVPFGAITSAKRIYLNTDQPIILKIDNIGDTGFQWQGAGYLSSGTTGISNLYITTGATDTNVEVVVAGD